MGDHAHLPDGPPVGRRPLPSAPVPSAPNRMAGTAQTKQRRERPVITVVDAKPMDQVGFRGVQAASPPPPPQKPAQTQEELVKMRPPPPTRPPSSYRRSMPINMDKVGLSTPTKPSPKARHSQHIKTTASFTFYMFNDDNTASSVSAHDCDAAETRQFRPQISQAPPTPARNVRKEGNDDTEVPPDIIAGQRIKAPPRNVDLLSDVPATSTQPTSPPKERPRGVPVFPMMLKNPRPLPADRGPPPPLPKKSPSVPNLLTMKGDATWSSATGAASGDDGRELAEAPQPSPVPRAVPRGPTVIRANRPPSSAVGNETVVTEANDQTSEGPRVPTIIRPNRVSITKEYQPHTEENHDIYSTPASADQKESKVRVPTIIRAARPPSMATPEQRHSAQSVTSQSSGHSDSREIEHDSTARKGSESNNESNAQGGGYVKALSDKLAGGVRVFPVAVPKANSDQARNHSIESQQHSDKNAETTMPKMAPPLIKPKPAPKPKPALKPKPATAAKPSNVARGVGVGGAKSAAFANSLKFAQNLQVDAPAHEAPHKPQSLSPRGLPSKGGLNLSQRGLSESEASKAHTDNNESQSTHTPQNNVDKIPKKGPMKATYRPTIIRAAVKTTQPETKIEQDAQEFAPVNKRLSSSCVNMNSGSGLSAMEISDKTYDSSIKASSDSRSNANTVKADESPAVAPQPVRRQRPTIIRPASTLNLSTPATDPNQSEDKPVATIQQSPPQRTKSVSFAHQPETETASKTQPEATRRSRPNSFGGGGGGILKSALSMPDISKRSGGPPPRPGAPPSRPGAPPSRRSSSRTTSESESIPAFSPTTPTSGNSFAVPPPSSSSEGKKKPPPRPSEGPKRRGSSSSSGLASPMNKRFFGSTPNLSASKRGSTSSASSGPGSPGLPRRPGPGHPLFHYVAQGPHAVALFDYEAGHDDELSFKAGSVVELVRQKNADWLVGRSGHKEGMFPVSFVDVIEPLPAHLVNDQIQVPPPEEQATPPTATDTGHGPRCRARFDYDATQDDDLPFKTNDVITLYEHVGDDWLKGELRGRVGMFPLAFVEIIEDVEEEREAPPHLPVNAPPPADGPSMPTWDDEPVLRDIHIATALHDFAGDEGELSFQTGAKIHLISRVNADWLYGSLGPVEGSFPANFIDHVPLDLPEHQSKEASPPPLPTSLPPLSTEKLESSTDPEPTHHKPEPVHITPEAVQDVHVHSHEEPGEWCIAKFDYPGDSNGDLPLTAGQRVQILEHVDSDWLRGRVGDKEGLFPLAFVEKLTEGHSHAQSLISHPDSQPGNATHSEPINKPETNSSATLATILHDFEAQTEGDLALVKGEEVLILESVGDDWLRGRIGDNEGIFPAAFVEVQA